MQAMCDVLDQCARHGLLAAVLRLAIPGGADHANLVVITAEADVAARDIVCDHEVEPLALELLPRVREQVAAWKGKLG